MDGVIRAFSLAGIITLVLLVVLFFAPRERLPAPMPKAPTTVAPGPYVVTLNAFGVVTFCWPADVLDSRIPNGAVLSNGVILSSPWLAGGADQLGIDPTACPGGRYLRP